MLQNGKYQYELTEKLSFTRYGGTAEEDRAADILLGEIEKMGGKGEKMPFTIPAFDVLHCEMSVCAPYEKSIACAPFGLGGDFPQGTELRPIYLARGAEADFVGIDSLEGCIALEPELVILPLKLKDAAEHLAGLGIPAICVNPESEALLIEAIDMIAKLTGTEDKAEALKDHGKKALAELEAKLADVEKPVVYLAGNSAYLSTAGSKMYQNSMIEAAGAVNAAAAIEDTYWAEIDYEQLITWNPDYIIVSPAADYTVDDILNDTALSELQAVKEGKVYAMPADYESWDSPVPSAFLGSMWIASQIHGDLFTADDYNSALTTYYETFYDFTAE